jgi:hypothetical protein
MRWTRTTSLDHRDRGSHAETWTLVQNGVAPQSFDVKVTVGKPFDPLRLKTTDLSEHRKYAESLKAVVSELLSKSANVTTPTTCPCCNAAAENLLKPVAIWDGRYVGCKSCGHRFLLPRPTKDAINSVFASSSLHATTYVDRDQIESRLNQVVTPKLEWMRSVFIDHYGREPSGLLDVGAGGGHFVEGCVRKGIAARGLEISKPSRDFAKEAFGIELGEADFLALKEGAVSEEIITFWGLLEYLPDPHAFVSQARTCAPQSPSMLVVEVPRFESLGAAVQAEFPEGVTRLLLPSHHMNIFTDSSLASLLVRGGFRPIAAWYFGMDIFETLMQLALKLDEERLIAEVKSAIPALQQACDGALLCDDIVIAAVPI